MANLPVRHIELRRIKSKWYGDLFTEWQPNKNYNEYLKSCIKRKKYLPPIVVAEEGDVFYIVNGHHRYYAHAELGKKTIKCILIEGTFKSCEPLRKAEVLLKEFDQRTEYRYQFSSYLDRWAAAAEKQAFINKYRPTFMFKLYLWVSKIKNRLGSIGHQVKKEENSGRNSIRKREE